MVSALTHRSMTDISATLPGEVIKPALEYPGIQELIDVDSIEEVDLKAAFQQRMEIWTILVPSTFVAQVGSE